MTQTVLENAAAASEIATSVKRTPCSRKKQEAQLIMYKYYLPVIVPVFEVISMRAGMRRKHQSNDIKSILRRFSTLISGSSAFWKRPGSMSALVSPITSWEWRRNFHNTAAAQVRSSLGISVSTPTAWLACELMGGLVRVWISWGACAVS